MARDLIGLGGACLAWLALFIAGGISVDWDLRVAQSKLPLANFGSAKAGGYFFVCLVSYFLFLAWVRARFYTNEALAFAFFLPVFFSSYYNFSSPNFLVALSYGATTFLYLLVAARLSTPRSGTVPSVLNTSPSFGAHLLEEGVMSNV